MNAPTAPLSQDAAAATPPSVTPPPQPRTLAETGLSPVLLRALLPPQMFLMYLEYVSYLSRTISLPRNLTPGMLHNARPLPST